MIGVDQIPTLRVWVAKDGWLSLHSWISLTWRDNVSVYERITMDRLRAHTEDSDVLTADGVVTWRNRRMPDNLWFGSRPMVLGSYSGWQWSPRLLDTVIRAYPYRNLYGRLGPNANTYVRWMLQMLKLPTVLPWNAFGRGYGA
jgi:hypothetical protein